MTTDPVPPECNGTVCSTWQRTKQIVDINERDSDVRNPVYNVFRPISYGKQQREDFS